MGILAWIIVGLIAGWAAGKVMKGGGYGVLMDIEGWLRRLGLKRYAAAFRENEIDDTILPHEVGFFANWHGDISSAISS